MKIFACARKLRKISIATKNKFAAAVQISVDFLVCRSRPLCRTQAGALSQIIL